MLYPANYVRGQVCPIHILQYLVYVYTWEKWWYVPPVVELLVMIDDIIYEGLSHVGNLEPIIFVG